jgi:hypothetical protein
VNREREGRILGSNAAREGFWEDAETIYAGGEAGVELGNEILLVAAAGSSLVALAGREAPVLIEAAASQVDDLYRFEVGVHGEVGAAAERVWVSGRGDLVIESSKLPGHTGMQVPRRLTPAEMESLALSNNPEFALIYRAGPGPNGGGGSYSLYSGTIDTVNFPVSGDVRWISHTHPVGPAWDSFNASNADQARLRLLQQMGSPQKSSMIIPEGHEPFRFDVTTKRK